MIWDEPVYEEACRIGKEWKELGQRLCGMKSRTGQPW